MLGSEIFMFFFKFSRIELPELVCSQFDPVHEVNNDDARKNSVIFITVLSVSQYNNNSLRGDDASLKN